MSVVRGFLAGLVALLAVACLGVLLVDPEGYLALVAGPVWLVLVIVGTAILGDG